MLSYEYLPLLQASPNSLASSQMMKTTGSYTQPVMPHLYGVKGRHPFDSMSNLTGFLAYNHHVGGIMTSLMVKLCAALAKCPGIFTLFLVNDMV